MDNIKILDLKNTTNINVPYSLGEVYKHEEFDEPSLKVRSPSFKDILFAPNLSKSNSVLKELKSSKNPIEYFTNSCWIIIWKNNETELFQLSNLGKITWLQKSKSRNSRDEN